MLHDSVSYKNARLDLFPFIENPKKVLDVGCNIGTTGLALKNKFGHHVHIEGLDYNEKSIKEAENKLNVAQAIDLNNLTNFEEFLQNKTFDYIIFADVLEHILHPQQIVDISKNHLTTNGKIIVSIPNYGFYLSIFYLLLHKWPHNERGIFDKTHINIYVKGNLNSLKPNGCELKILLRKYRLFESRGSKYDRFLKLINYIPWLRNFFTFQFILEIKKIKL